MSGTVGGTVDGTVKVKPKPRIPVAIELVAPPYTVPEEEKKKKEKEAEHSMHAWVGGWGEYQQIAHARTRQSASNTHGH